MTLAQWLVYLESLHPNEIELGLDRIALVFDKLNLDFNEQKIITVGGTNGKGSTVSMLASILQALGYRVGTYTSPHLTTYNERVSINQKNATDQELCHAFQLVEEVRGNIELTYFEFGTLAAFIIFSKQKLDYIVLEVGLGGRLDAVNLLDADLSILTNVALDHIDWLGETREEIGFEKAGIYRHNCPALFGESDIPVSVEKQINKIGANLLLCDRDFHYEISDQADTWSWQGKNSAGGVCQFSELPLSGFSLNYALSNAALALQGIALLESSLTKQDIEVGLGNVSLAGRFQLIDRGHQLILDVAHNPHAAENLLSHLQKQYPQRKIHIVIAMLADKDMMKVVDTLNKTAKKWYVGEIKQERGSPAKIIYNHLRESGEVEAACFDTIEEAFYTAENEANSTDIVLVTGSFYTVSRVMELI